MKCFNVTALGRDAAEVDANNVGTRFTHWVHVMERLHPVQVSPTETCAAHASSAHLAFRCSGSRSGQIHHHDVRSADHHVATLSSHTQEVFQSYTPVIQMNARQFPNIRFPG